MQDKKPLSLAETYISRIGEMDQYARQYNPNNDELLEVSQACGRACIDLVNGREDGLNQLQGQLEKIKDNREETSYWRDKANLFALSLVWLDRRNDPDGLKEVQDMIQTETCNQLKNSLENIPFASYAARPHMLSKVSELSSIALINFLRDPSLVAFPALPHHEQGLSAKDNYDIVLLHANNGYPEMQPIQVKLGCQNFCEKPPVKPHKKNKLGNYSKDIALISGHCDLKISHLRDEEPSYPVTEALLKAEYEPSAMSNEEIGELCDASDRLLEILTGMTLLERTGKSSTRNWRKPRRLKAA